MKRITMLGLVATAVVAALAVLSADLLSAQDHPGSAPAKKKDTPLSAGAIGSAVRDYISKDVKVKGGYFLVWDKAADAPLALTLDKVHEALAAMPNNQYFACADFKTKDGKKTYDVDFILKGKSVESLEMYEITVHKEDGNPRYNWAESGGVFTKKSAK